MTSSRPVRSTCVSALGGATSPGRGMATTSVWVKRNPVARSASTDTGFDGAISSLRYVSGGRPSSSHSASNTGCMAGGTSAWVRLNVPTTPTTESVLDRVDDIEHVHAVEQRLVVERDRAVQDLVRHPELVHDRRVVAAGDVGAAEHGQPIAGLRAVGALGLLEHRRARVLRWR